MRMMASGFVVGVVSFWLTASMLGLFRGSTIHPDVLRLSNLAQRPQAIKGPRVFCWVPSRASYGPVLERILATWARSCDLMVFIALQDNRELNVIKVAHPTNQQLWNMIHPSWLYISRTFLSEYDWFVKVDDDSYFSGDNFKALVQSLNPKAYHYLGHTAWDHIKPISSPFARFNLGGAHAVSQSTLRRIASFLPDSPDPLPPGFTQKCSRDVS